MIDQEKLKTHPLTIAVAKIEANIMAAREIQVDLIKELARDLDCNPDLLIKAMGLASEDMREKQESVCEHVSDAKVYLKSSFEQDGGIMKESRYFKCMKCGEYNQ